MSAVRAVQDEAVRTHRGRTGGGGCLDVLLDAVDEYGPAAW